MRFVRLFVAASFILGSNLANSADLFGVVAAPNGNPVCALVLASGRSMFSCSPIGQYSLSDLPLENDGSIKLAVYADGFRPYSQRLTSFGETPVTLVRQYDNGLSDRGSLNGVYRLIRLSGQGNDGLIVDSDLPGISATGSMTINGSSLSRNFTVTSFGEPISENSGGSFSDLSSAIEIFDGVNFIDGMLVERGKKTVMAFNFNNVGTPATEVTYWFRVSSVVPSAVSASSIETGDNTEPLGTGIAAAIERLR